MEHDGATIREPLASFSMATVPDDSLYASQWYFSPLQAPTAWDVTTGSQDVVIAVLDSGVDLDHPDLAGNIWMNTGEIPGNGIDDDLNGFIDDVHGWDFVQGSADPNPKFDGAWTDTGMSHGTVVAGIAAAVGNNAAGISGVVWTSRVMSVRVLDGSGLGDTLTIAEGVNYAVAKGADIINLSLVGSTNSQVLQEAITNAAQHGALVVAAAGNNNVNLATTPQYPVCNDNVIGVAATDELDHKTSFSNYGPCIDISAPGINMTSTVFYSPGQGFTDYYQSGWYGTSVASPVIAGALSLIMAKNPLLFFSEVSDVLFQGSDDLDAGNPSYAGQLGAGRVNLAKSINSEQAIVLSDLIVTGAGPGGSPHVRLLNASGNVASEFFAYATTFPGGVEVASGDVNGDGTSELITGVGPGGGPQVRVFRTNGSAVFTPGFFAYASTFRNGVHVAVGDLDGDGMDEIITGPGNGGGPQVRVFDRYGKPKFTPGFFAFDQAQRGGVFVAAGDVNGDGVDEIIAGAGVGTVPEVRIFDRFGTRKYVPFLAYAATFRGGVSVASGDVNGDGVDEIVTGPFSNGGPHVRIFTKSGTVLGQFFAYASTFRGGVHVAAGDVNNDGTDDIVAGAGYGGGPQVRLFNLTGKVLGQFFAYTLAFRGGVFVGVVAR